MAEQVCEASAQEYPAEGGVLVIENIFDEGRSKLDAVKELLESGAYPCDGHSARPAGMGMAGRGSREGKVGG